MKTDIFSKRDISLDQEFKATMKDGSTAIVKASKAFQLYDSNFFVITDGKTFGIAEEETGCLITGDHETPHIAIGIAYHYLYLSKSPAAFFLQKKELLKNK